MPSWWYFRHLSAVVGLGLRWGFVLGTPELVCKVLSMAGSFLLSWAVERRLKRQVLMGQHGDANELLLPFSKTAWGGWCLLWVSSAQWRKLYSRWIQENLLQRILWPRCQNLSDIFSMGGWSTNFFFFFGYFLGQFPVCSKIEPEVQKFPIYPLLPHTHSLPHHQHPTRVVHLLRLMNLHWHIIPPNS